ncbi:MAG: ORC1-type DNA replication protein [Candidatus Methanomethylicia archaeon]|nr:ORC1-type DNA replication protein [Candidatus Methanomethylicia archaeon]MCX8168976.1 ORC1-type DNA replication protein [Candidatus Methanomethylicia archaeon]MDW7988708.1 ORC1-type DNA replication protein [Nitrososphaerota archaeon]
MSKIIEEELFKRTKRIIKDESKLSPDYVPQNLVHRENEIRQLSNYFRHVIDVPGKVSQKVLIIGPVGTGKTATSKLFGLTLSDIVKRTGIKLRYVHVNCHKNRTLFFILTRIAKSLIEGFPDRGLSTQELLNIIYDKLEEEDEYLLLTLDEIDYLIKVGCESSFYDLLRISDEYVNRPQRMNFILIARDQSFLPLLDHSTQSVLMKNIIRFKPYIAEQLRDILIERVKESFHENTISHEVIWNIAEIAAKRGDARYALEILWRAAKIAEMEGKNTVSFENVRMAASMTYLGICNEEIDSLSDHEKLLLLSIVKCLKKCEQEYVNIGEVEKTYKLLCEEYNVEPRGHTKVWEYIQNLKNIGLIATRVCTIEPKGRTTQISLMEIPAEILEKELIKRILVK